MLLFAVIVAGTAFAAPPPAEDLGRILLWVAGPAVILATIAAVALLAGAGRH